MKFLHVLCLSKIDREKVFADVLDKKEAFKDYKNNCVRKTQNENFSKVHRFGPKLGFSTCRSRLENLLGHGGKEFWMARKRKRQVKSEFALFQTS